MKFIFRKYYYIFLIIDIFFFCPNKIYAGEIREKAEKLILEIYSDSVKILEYKYTLSQPLKLDSEKYARQRFLGKFVYYYEIKKEEETVGFALLDNVKGKVKPITYMIIFNTDLSIKRVEIIKYREEHGSEVENKFWLSQFESKTIESNLILNNSIDGISGATISVKSIIKGVKRLLYLINHLGENEKSLLVSIE